MSLKLQGQYVCPKRITRQFDITSTTLRRWAEADKIKYIRPNGRDRRYNIDDVRRVLGVEDPEPAPRTTVCYARVSSHHQKHDLQRQIELLQQHFPGQHVVSDIGSGLNWRRPGFVSLLERIHGGAVEQVVVTYKDRLCRFGFELVEWICKKAGTRIVVLGGDGSATGTGHVQELAEDLLAVTTVFVAKNNGMRAAEYRKRRKHQGKEQQEEEGEKQAGRSESY